MKKLGFGRDYVYAPDTDDGIGQMSCLPDSLRGTEYYRPGARGFEAELNERMQQIRQWHRNRRALAEEKAEPATEPGDDRYETPTEPDKGDDQ
jgi:hypothetical protein